MTINCLLKDAKSEILANFIYSNNKRVIITTNKAAVASDLINMEKYVKYVDNIKSEDTFSPYARVAKDRLCLFFFLSYFYFYLDLFSIFGNKG